MVELGEFSAPVVQIINILVGIVILVAGRRMFWLAVGAVGFLVGLGLALNYLEIESAVVLVLIGLIAGVIGILVALFLQQVAIVMAGFFMGGYLSLGLVDLLTIDPAQWEWLIFIVGGVIGAIIVSVLFEYALIGLSSLIGATMISQSLNLSPQMATIVWVGLFIVGLVVQTRTSISATSQPASSRRPKQ